VEGLGERLDLGARLVGLFPRQPQQVHQVFSMFAGKPPCQLHHVQAGESKRGAPRPTLRRRSLCHDFRDAGSLERS
jgi:hypothetical protein